MIRSRDSFRRSSGGSTYSSASCRRRPNLNRRLPRRRASGAAPASFAPSAANLSASTRAASPRQAHVARALLWLPHRYPCAPSVSPGGYDADRSRASLPCPEASERAVGPRACSPPPPARRRRRRMFSQGGVQGSARHERATLHLAKVNGGVGSQVAEALPLCDAQHPDAPRHVCLLTVRAEEHADGRELRARRSPGHPPRVNAAPPIGWSARSAARTRPAAPTRY